jgi:hypothetical protein
MEKLKSLQNQKVSERKPGRKIGNVEAIVYGVLLAAGAGLALSHANKVEYNARSSYNTSSCQTYNSQ